jgi:hypothetical protein
MVWPIGLPLVSGPRRKKKGSDARKQKKSGTQKKKMSGGMVASWGTRVFVLAEDEEEAQKLFKKQKVAVETIEEVDRAFVKVGRKSPMSRMSRIPKAKAKAKAKAKTKTTTRGKIARRQIVSSF